MKKKLAGLAHEAKQLDKIARALGKWKEAAEEWGPESDRTRKVGAPAMQLLHKHLGLLKRYHKYFEDPNCTSTLVGLHEMAKFCSTEEFGVMADGGWYQQCCDDAFVNDIKRCAQRLQSKVGKGKGHRGRREMTGEPLKFLLNTCSGWDRARDQGCRKADFCSSLTDQFSKPVSVSRLDSMLRYRRERYKK